MVSFGVLAAIGTIIGTVLLLYRYYFVRPSLSLQIEKLGDADHEGQVPLFFSIKNDGREFGEDAYVVLELENWSFDFIDPKTFDKFVQGTEYNWSKFPPGDTEVPGNFTEVHQIHVTTPVYESATLYLTLRIAQLKKGETYDMDYWIACRSHPPRNGTFSIDLDDDGAVSITSTQPTFWNRVKSMGIPIIESRPFSDNS